jgi:hypothetical protein
MAGHYKLTRQAEPEIFNILEYLAEQGIVFHADDMQDFEIDEFREYKIRRLPSDYVEDRINQVALMVGNFTLQSITDEHPTLTTDIMLEVHFMNRSVVNVFWVA